MYYKFNKEILVYEKISTISVVLNTVSIFICLFLIGIISSSFINTKKEQIITPEEKLIIIKEYNQFTPEKLYNYIHSLNFKFPEIIIAQSKLETNNYTSNIFLESNNLFGMKEATSRANLAKGTSRGHAYYNNWKESVLDYALYYSTYLYRLETKEQYFEYLKQNYAEDPNYVNKLKQLINN